MISIFKQIHDQQAHNSIQKRQQNREQVQEEEPSHLQNIIGFEQQENQIIEEKNISQQFISPEKQQENSQNIMNYLYTPENQNNSSHYQQQEEQQIETKFNQKQSSPQPQQGYEENEEEEEEQEGDWLTHKLQNNQLKRLIEYSNYNRFFKSFKKYNFKPSQAIIQPQAKSIDLDKEDESTEIKIKQIESIMKRRVIMNIIASIQAKEQEKIKSEEYEQIIKFTIAKREKQLIKKAFEGLFTVVEDKWGNKVKQLCFTGWLSHIKQKKMLKEYLKMQAAGQENRSTYYAQTIQDKQAFQRLRDLI